MFDTVLIANRGEIALRIQRACRGLGLRTVAAYSEADRDAPHVQQADMALCIGPAAPARSYLNQAALLAAAQVSGAQAIHPGYGFLSENSGFVARVEEAGLTFIGPSAACIRTMGDKVAAKRAMRAAGVPCVPGPDSSLPDDPAAVRALARDIGYPVIVKAAGGGGGRGMRVVADEAALADALALTREEARRAFGNPEVYIEKFLLHPRHVEIQVLADRHGQALWLGSRDCSLQRRHQKVLEEAPAPGIDAQAIAAVGERCTQACRQIGYVGVGTFEFLYEDGRFFFIEMNTRLQVEHPVTEMTTGIDIVQQQLRVARGERLALQQADITCHGHAFECRINAEDPDSFAPSPGRISQWQLPGGFGVRVDSHASAGYRVPPYYDSLIAKLVVHGATRADALARLRVALDEMVVGGIRTNLPLHRRLVDEPGFAAGGVDIHHLERWLATAARAMTVSEHPTLSLLGTSALLLEAPGETTLATQQRIWALASEAEAWPEVREAVPGMNNLMLVFRTPPAQLQPLQDRLQAAWRSVPPLTLQGRVVELPVVYGGDGGPHMADVVAHTGLSVDEIVERHSAPVYPVYALGSHPGYCYLGGMDPRIATPRRLVPVLRIPGGAVSIGGMQTGVSASDGPSGWNTIGCTRMAFFDPLRQPPALLQPGDSIRFRVEQVIR